MPLPSYLISLLTIQYTQSDAIVSASWDSTIKLTSLSDPSTPSTILRVPDKVYSLALSKTKMVAAMGGRAVWIYDVRNLKEVMEKRGEEVEGEIVEPFQKRESSLKFMTRAVRCMPNDEGELIHLILTFL